jgi:hypothetical protein
MARFENIKFELGQELNLGKFDEVQSIRYIIDAPVYHPGEFHEFLVQIPSDNAFESNFHYSQVEVGNTTEQIINYKFKYEPLIIKMINTIVFDLHSNYTINIEVDYLQEIT